MALTKILNDENKSFKPVLTDKLVYDTKPTVNSFNGITSDAVARAIAGASGEVPGVTEADNGKVLTAVYDEGGAAVEWADAQGGGAEYSAGTGISISAQDEISVDTTVIATKNDLSSYQPTISDLDTIRSGASAGATAVQPTQLATVATTGSYNDLSGKPTIPAAQVNSDWNAASGVSQILNKPSLATVATSGSYADLSNKPTIPTVDQSYSASSTNAQSGTAVAGALATVNQVPASTSADEDKVLTVNSSGTPVWAAAQGGGSSYTFSAPLSESAGTVSLSLDSATLKTQRYTTDKPFDNSLQNSNGYAAGSVGVYATDDIFVSMTIPISQDFYGQKAYQNKTILPILIGDLGWGSYSNQWVIANASVSVAESGADKTLTCEFTINPSPSSPNYPTSLNGTSLGSANYLAFGVFDSASALTTRSSSQIYGASSDTATYQYGSPLVSLAVKHPVPAVTSGDNGKVLKATYAGGVGSFGWDTAPTELPSVTGNAGKVLTVNSGATGVEWATAQGGNVTDYVATYISSSNKPSNDWCSGLHTAMDNGQRIGVFVKMLAFSGSYSSGRVDPYATNAKIYLPLVSVIDKSEPDQYTTFVYEYNFCLYDGVNKLKITLTDTWQNSADTYVWSAPTISQ